MKRRRLRKLVPDAELIRRRAAGETFRELARDYEVAHTTLGRYFARPEVRKELRQAVEELRAAQRAAAARRAAERRQEQELRRKARKQAAAERGQARHARAAVAAIASRRRPARSEYELWLDERDAVVPLTRVDRYSQLDEMAARAVAAGGGMQAVLEATDLRTRENVVVPSTRRSSCARSTTTRSRRRSLRRCKESETPPSENQPRRHLRSAPIASTL